MSNDKDSVLAVARNEKKLSDAIKIIKDPMYLEFLGLHREASYYEKDWNRPSLRTYMIFCWKWVTASHLWPDRNVYILRAMNFL
ncbi:hypothetical protein [Mucilaginibacter rubeus]|uniref:hypothetical protein n=1 Tax=Mucilaginibacter rubeus TaxID=2027860 RepID=UPI0019C0FF33|nr:hypothetical protein [Mucilaginibacter rubeus]GGB20758.1 hypothetical protein GCM10011500_41040 [Mucilaginibacter rubeus]